jgi:hypothetical protein
VKHGDTPAAQPAYVSGVRTRAVPAPRSARAFALIHRVALAGACMSGACAQKTTHPELKHEHRLEIWCEQLVRACNNQAQGILCVPL